MTFYIAVLEQDCDPHYFEKPYNAVKYLEENVMFDNCKIDTDRNYENGELYDETGVSVGYFYKVETED